MHYFHFRTKIFYSNLDLPPNLDLARLFEKLHTDPVKKGQTPTLYFTSVYDTSFPQTL